MPAPFDPEARFGWSTAIDYGNTAVVGAPMRDRDGYFECGEVHVFHREGMNSWVEDTVLTAGDKSSRDQFGYSVAISPGYEWDFIVVGANTDTIDPYPDAGSVHVYERDPLIPNKYVFKNQLTAPDMGEYDHFGESVAIDGSYIVIGAPGCDIAGENSGAVYIFHESGNWQFLQKLIAPVQYQCSQALFGYSVAIDLPYVVIGARYDVDITGDRYGAAYVYELKDGTFHVAAKMTASNGENHDFFGHSVAIDETFFLVGAPENQENGLYAGMAYVYETGELPEIGEWTNAGKGLNDAVYALCQFDGYLIAGGMFTKAGDLNCNHIARWDGEEWDSLGSGTSGTVFDLEVADNGNSLIVAGSFFYAGGENCRMIAKWDGASWYPIGTGMNAMVTDIHVVPTDTIIAGGWFTEAGGHAECGYLAFFDLNSSSDWAPWGSGPDPGVSNFVYAVTSYDSKWIAGGQFRYAGGVLGYLYIAEWDPVTSTWSMLGGGMNESVSVLDVYPEYPEGDLIAGGSFTTADGSSAPYIARWDGAAWHDMGGGMDGDPYPYVYALEVFPPTSFGDLVAGGHFHTAGGVSVNNIACWDGSLWSSLGLDLGPVYALTTYKGHMYAAGEFIIGGGGFSAMAGEDSLYNIALWRRAYDPTVVELAAFEARGYDKYILLEWTTGSELNNAGYNIYRGTGGSGPRTRINSELIVSLDSYVGGGSYSFRDNDVMDDVVYCYWLEDVDDGGVCTAHGPVTASLGSGGEGGVPEAFRLFQNNPNPFNPVTTIRYDLPVGCTVSLGVYNTLGQRITKLVDGFQVSGSKVVTWDGTNTMGRRVSSGIYFYRLEAGGFIEIKKMVLLR